MIDYVIIRKPLAHWRSTCRVLVAIVPARSRREALRMAPAPMHEPDKCYGRRTAMEMPALGQVIAL